MATTTRGQYPTDWTPVPAHKIQDQIQDPQIVDVASASTSAWPVSTKGVPKKGSYSRRRRRRSSSGGSGSGVQPSTRQSDISLGILDYYMREPSPNIHSPEIPPRPRTTPKLDPAMDRFDFGLSAAAATTPTPLSSSSSSSQSGRPLIPISPPSHSRPSATLARRGGGYTLFPVIQEITPPPRQPKITLVEPSTLPLPQRTPTATVVCSSDGGGGGGSSSGSSGSHHSHHVASPPETTYRPRKESISSSIRTRNDSINSFQARLALRTHQRKQSRVPLRILSLNLRASSSSSSISNTTTSSHQRQPSTPRTATTTTGTTGTTYSPSSLLFFSSPPPPPPSVSEHNNKSRWSDESTTTTFTTTAATSNNNNNTIPTKPPIIQSPSHAPTPDPRTSFASLLRRDSAQYPACFFDDDDDDDDDGGGGDKGEDEDESVPLRRRKWVWNRNKMMMISSFSSDEDDDDDDERRRRGRRRRRDRDRNGVREIWDGLEFTSGRGGGKGGKGGKGGGGFWKGLFCGCAGR